MPTPLLSELVSPEHDPSSCIHLENKQHSRQSNAAAAAAAVVTCFAEHSCDAARPSKPTKPTPTHSNQSHSTRIQGQTPARALAGVGNVFSLASSPWRAVDADCCFTALWLFWVLIFCCCCWCCDSLLLGSPTAASMPTPTIWLSRNLSPIARNTRGGGEDSGSLSSRGSPLHGRYFDEVVGTVGAVACHAAVVSS